MSIEVTDEMRAAVMAEMCDRDGHSIALDRMFNTTERGRNIGGHDDREPHIYCTRCGMVWLVINDPAGNYDEAEMRLRDRLYKADPLNKRPERPRLSKK